MTSSCSDWLSPKAFRLNVQTTSTGLMGTIAHGNCLSKNIFPVHFLCVIIQCHRVRNNLKAIIQTAIWLDVDGFKLCISNAFQSVGVIIILASVIHFQFYTEISLSISVENGRRFVAVIFDFILQIFKAAFTIWQIIVPIAVVIR